MSTTLAGKDINGELLFLSRELKTPVIAATFAALGDQAREQGWSHEEYFAAVLGRQVASRAANGIKMRISSARFPVIKTLEDFTFEHLPTAPRDVIAHLATTTFVARKENVVLLGPPERVRPTWRSRWRSRPPSRPTRSCSTPRPDKSPAWLTPTTKGASPKSSAG